MKNKGFTLVELLAVLVILAVIALITVPAISKVIKRQKMNTFSINTQSMVKVAQTDWYNNERVSGSYKYQNNKLMYVSTSSDTTDIDNDGKLEGGVGVIKVTSDGKFIYAIHDDDWCAIMESTDTEATISEYAGDCSL